MTTRIRLNDEQGWALATAMLLMAIMLATILGVARYVDGQSKLLDTLGFAGRSVQQDAHAPWFQATSMRISAVRSGRSIIISWPQGIS